jgi:hypothetical protein
VFDKEKNCNNFYYQMILIKNSVVDPDPDWFGSPGSGYGSEMRIRIQEQGNRPKFTNKPYFQPLKKPFVPT